MLLQHYVSLRCYVEMKENQASKKSLEKVKGREIGTERGPGGN